MRFAAGKTLGLPNPVPVSERNQKRLGLLLTLTVGYFDGYSLVVLGVYVSFMSGNTTMAGVKADQENFLAILAPAVAILGFVTGSFIGSLITQARIRHTHRILFGVIATVLVIVLTLNEQFGSHAVLKNFIIGLLSLAMGMVNPALSKVGAEAVSLTFMTGTLSRIGNHLALALRRESVPGAEGPWDNHLRRARVAAQLWGAFITDAALAGIMTSYAANCVLLPGIAIMVLLALFVPSEPPAVASNC